MSKLSKMDEILLSGNPTQFVKEQSRQNGKAKPLHFDPYQYEYSGYDACVKKPVFVCKKCNADYTWLKRVIHRVYFECHELHGGGMREGQDRFAIIQIKEHYKKVLGDVVPLYPDSIPVPLLENGICLKCRKPARQIPEQGSLF